MNMINDVISGFRSCVDVSYNYNLSLKSCRVLIVGSSISRLIDIYKPWIIWPVITQPTIIDCDLWHSFANKSRNKFNKFNCVMNMPSTSVSKTRLGLVHELLHSSTNYTLYTTTVRQYSIKINYKVKVHY